MLDFPFCVAIHAPGHPQGRNPLHAVHGFDGAMTLLTSEARLDVALMGEMDEVGHVVDLDPRNRFTILPILENFQDLGFVPRDDLMTTDALVDARDARRRRLVRVHMTVQAFNPILTDMNAMAEINGLYRGLIGVISGVDPPAEQESYEADDANQRWFEKRC